MFSGKGVTGNLSFLGAAVAVFLGVAVAAVVVFFQGMVVVFLGAVGPLFVAATLMASWIKGSSLGNSLPPSIEPLTSPSTKTLKVGSALTPNFLNISLLLFFIASTFLKMACGVFFTRVS